MSRSYTSRPGVARQERPGAPTRGRGRGTVTDADARPTPSTAPQQPEERVQRRDAYTVIVPDQQKRQKIADKAKAEENAYKKYKEQRKPGPVSYVGTPGGGLMDEGTVRQQSQQQHRTLAATRGRGTTASFQHHRTSMKQREQEEIDKKKAEQRRKAEQNKNREANRQQSLAEQHRAQNAAFLDRLEQQSKRPKPSATASAATATAAATAATSQGYGGRVDSRSQNLDMLIQEFPFYERDMLEDILIQAGGSLDSARSLLQD